ncbi:plasmid stabilization system [Limnochorda pilosa]|uniref:Plasmid stabilization system n=2 Tax=Limnochorda pilosa TaxID=1555112 RepID=A0A0K2SNN7_LIMPI|nr:plasmid stabilization system [Limnochorda pilosa]
MGRVRFHEQAEQELVDAARYYESKSPGLGFAFLDEVERATAEIVEHPEAAPRIRGLIRRKLVRRFPYSVMYSAENDVVRMLAIANQKRRPTTGVDVNNWATRCESQWYIQLSPQSSLALGRPGA